MSDYFGGIAEFRNNSVCATAVDPGRARADAGSGLGGGGLEAVARRAQARAAAPRAEGRSGGAVARTDGNARLQNIRSQPR